MLKRKNMVKLLGMGSLCLFLLGCSEESFLLQEESSAVILQEETVLSQQEELSILKKDANSEPVSVLQEPRQETVTGENSVLTENFEEANMSAEQSAKGNIAVHICGAVNQPGVYYFKDNQRVQDGIRQAGGFREDADQDYLNQAMVLEDGMKIVVPTKEETEQIKNTEETFVQQGSSSDKNGTGNSSGKVDLNTADETLLCTLPGIGESRAKSIVAYREEHGPFEKTEDVMKVSGIKEAAFEKIKDYVTVSR